MKNILSFYLLILLMMPFQTLAAWFEVTGQAQVLESDKAARNNALEDAVYQAILYSGADASSFSHLRPYLNQERSDYQFSGNEVRHVQIVKAKKSGGKYYVTARIDIYPSAKTCHKTQYKKAILISGFTLTAPQHAALGGIYQIGDDFSVMLQRQIERKSQSFVVSGITRVPFRIDQPNTLTMLAEDHDAQYLVTGAITDLTSTLDTKFLSDDQYNRQFAATFEVINGKTGELILQKNYREVAHWSFSRTSQVDTKSARFWQSGYGQAVQRTSRNMMLDLETALACRSSLPEVINVYQNTIQTNVGRIHGVKQGDQLRLWHNAAFIDQQGISRNRMVQTDITLTVERVYDKSSELSVNRADLASSIQPGDLLTKQITR
ncbi:flagellar basal-body protein [Photobacterium jeanii]|uniref:Flagellar basal-body protein n=1 Tax=Photobacterium jeanii TaxID=858640 RepID=A0A178KAE7_9GAMM|nr:flagella assembly protein FlgT [Photobacterium jeanii]OAN13935.1 flagellar basal-body protein [Photobacterium jeanii]PST89921.1 flagellar basal-body protein [Photobacterium jeanii]